MMTDRRADRPHVLLGAQAVWDGCVATSRMFTARPVPESGVPADGQAVRANCGECAGRERYGADCRRRGMPAYGYPDRDDQIVDIY